MMKLLFCFLFIAFGNGLFAQDYDPSGSLLWEISTAKGKSYLFGTLHSNDKRLFNLPDSVYVSFLNSKSLALEVNVQDLFLDKDPIPKKANILIDKQGRLYTASDEPTETYYGNEDGMPQFMDAWFQEKGELLNKPIIALESIAQQTKALEEIPFIEYEKNTTILASEKRLMHQYYLSGRIDLIDRLIKGRLFDNKEAYLKLIEKRNFALADSIVKLANRGTVFFAIGVGHLHGEKGLVSLLRKRGCKLRQIQLITSENSVNEKTQIQLLKNKEAVEHFGTTALKFSMPGIARQPLIETAKEYSFIYKELGQGNTYKLTLIPRDTSLTFLELGEILIASPQKTSYYYGVLDDGTEYIQGLSDAYPDGIIWMRILVNEAHVLIASCSGGNKFMNSNRPFRFFDQIVLE